MKLSFEDLFSNEQTLATAAQANNSTNTLDFKSNGDDIDHLLRWFLLITNAPATSAGATLTVTWQTSANNSDWTTLWTSDTFAAASLTDGAYVIKRQPLPAGLLRYNKLVFTTGTGAWSTAPIVTAAIVQNDEPVE